MYEGGFSAGTQHGRGKHTSAVGSVFEGQWLDQGWMMFNYVSILTCLPSFGTRTYLPTHLPTCLPTYLYAYDMCTTCVPAYLSTYPSRSLVWISISYPSIHQGSGTRARSTGTRSLRTPTATPTRVSTRSFRATLSRCPAIRYERTFTGRRAFRLP